jgi:hypothetical protein
MKVTYVQNFTDVDDKLIKKANEEGITVPEVAERYIAEFQTDATGLNVRPATVHPRATENMAEIIDIVSNLIDKGYAYRAENGDVYFRPRRFTEYGKLSHQPIDELESGARISVGELKEEREAGYTDALVEYQTLIALTGLTDEQVADVVVAYEPVWAIGTGLTATDEQANETIGVIRKAVARVYGQECADKVRIQYGGSMNPKNVKGLMAQPEIDGGLIGGASLKAADFSMVVNYDK